MARLIDADALINKYGDWYTEEGTEEGFIGSLKTLIDAQPTIDAEPVRHGKNVGTDYDETDQFVCSECGIEIQGWYRVERDEDDGEETIHEYRFRYCPQCGASVDGK